jgi:predicted PurR-regulated permease PerM
VTERLAPRDLTSIVLGVLAIGGLTAGSAWLMWPFVGATVWATTIVIATWPVLLWLERRFGGRRAPAVVVMLLAMLALLVVPVWLGISTIADNYERVGQLARTLAREGLPPPPEWVSGLPVVGPRLAEAWRSAAGHPESLVARVLPQLGDMTKWIGSKIGGLGAVVVQFLLTMVISGILYASGEKAAHGVRRFLRRLAGDRGENSAVLAAKAVRAVALGIVVTAVTQTALSGIGLAVVGVPHAALLTAVVFVLCIAQLGPLLVMAPATIWLYVDGSAIRGTVLLVFTVVAVTLDNFLRPVLIRKGADLPLLLILAGVFGGLMAMGVLGLFVGPVLLAVTWTLLASWVGDLDRHHR